MKREKYEEKARKLNMLFPQEHIEGYFQKWISYGFHKLMHNEILEIVSDSTLRARPVKKEGIETIFELRRPKRKIVVCSSHSEFNGFKVFDQGWILIVDYQSRGVLFLPPMNRTPKFFSRMDERIVACMDMVEHWPRCPQCNQELRMIYDKEKSVESGFDPMTIWFSCPFGKFHNKNVTQSLFEITGLSKHNRDVLLKPFIALNKRRKKNPNSLSRRFIRWCTIHDVPIPWYKMKPYNDLEHEKSETYTDGEHIVPLDTEVPFIPDPSY